MPLRIGYVGLGQMGSAMCERILAAGHALTVYARRAEVLESWRARGVGVVSDLAAVANQSDIVCINVTSTTDVQSVLFGDEPGTTGLARDLAPNTLVIDFSTISADATRKLAQRLGDRGIRMLDCPVSGGVKGATDGTLSIMVGGHPTDLARAMPLLSILGRTITHIGDHGAGQVAKACNQIIQVVNIEGIAEAMRLVQASGVDGHRVLEALGAGFAQSRMLELMGPKMVDRDFRAGIEARLHEKDFGLIVEMIEARGLDLPAVKLVRAQLARLVESGWGRDDTSSLLRVLEEGPHAATGDASN